MKQYLDLLSKVLNEGEWRNNRTGIRTKMIDGAMLQFDLQKGFPAVTTKKLAFNAVKGELIGFIRGYTSAAAFRELGCKVWDQNANENVTWLSNPNRKGTDDLGRVYGAQWRKWNLSIDQLADAVHEIIHNPTSRRIIVTAWQPAELGKMALPPCHLLYQFLVSPETLEISMCMYQRSCDMFLGVPFNIASYALLLELVARATGYKPKNLTMFLADVHIYENHIQQVEEQIKREPYDLPILCIDAEGFNGTRMNFLEGICPEDLILLGYKHHQAIKGDMAV